MASMPVSAVTRRGCVTVNSGSKSATRQVAFLSPQAILTCVLASEIKANDCVSLPVPAVVGTAIIGSIGAGHLARAPVVLHPAAAGIDEVDSLGDSPSSCRRRGRSATPARSAERRPGRLRHYRSSGFRATSLNKCVSMPALSQARRCPRSACPAATMPGSLTTSARRRPSSLANSPSESTCRGRRRCAFAAGSRRGSLEQAGGKRREAGGLSKNRMKAGLFEMMIGRQGIGSPR